MKLQFRTPLRGSAEIWYNVQSLNRGIVPMKKILALMAMFTLAFGAQAEDVQAEEEAESYSYTFNVDIVGLPSDFSFSGNTGLYLIDMQGAGRVLSYTLSQSDNYVNLGEMGWTMTSKAEHTADTVVVHGKEYKLEGHEVKAGANLSVDKNKRFKFTGSIYGLTPGEANPLDALKKGDLKLVVDSDSGAYFESMDFTWGRTEGGTYVVAGTIYVNVPEPTSGLLLLMGVAGLALRRKRAA